jgi:hypothetical protein
VKGLAVLGTAVLASVLVMASPSRAADECRGLQVCIPVAGPWVVIPARTAANPYPSRAWLLRCPRGSIVGGVDARLTSRELDMSFAGLLGSPVNPGITTTNEVVFTATYTGGAARPAAFRPFIGCIPTAGGGRIPTGLRTPAAVKPGRPTVLRVRTAAVEGASPTTVGQGCSRGERLVSAGHAVALRSSREPTLAQLRGVRSTLVRRGARAVATASLHGAALRMHGRLQLRVVCARGAVQP